MLYKMLTKKNFLLFFLLVFSFLINFYYGSRGVLPQDTFAFFDSGFRVLNGSIPFKDYWTISGPVIDFFQLIIFSIFEINWTSYMIQGSILNSLITIFTFYVFVTVGLNKYYSFFYALCFAVLANPSMGTPFIDHYSAFLSLLSFYCFIISIHKKNKLYWFLIPIFLFLGFFSKQTPAAYLIISMFSLILIYTLIYKNLEWFYLVFCGSILSISFLVLFILVYNINFESFYIQYFLFPQTIGADRIKNFNFTLNGVVFHFKFIYLVLLPILVGILSQILRKEVFVERKKFLTNLTILFLTISLIYHQVLTRNFTFIFFLIPLIAGFCHYNFLSNSDLKKIIIPYLILITLFSTVKYHFRFNEGRKLLVLQEANLNLSVDAKYINKKLSGLKWINHTYSKNPKEEMNLIKESLSHLENDKRNIMLLTEYIFISSILNRDFNYPVRWPSDDVSNPNKNNKYYPFYISFVKKLIIDKNIEAIYTTLPTNLNEISPIFKNDCLESKNINKMLVRHNIKNCF